MTGEEMLLELIIEANREVLEELEVELVLKDLYFSFPAARVGDNYNTVVSVEAISGPCEGYQTYQYTRHDLQQAFADAGYDEVTVQMQPDQVNDVSVLMALNQNHNLQLKAWDLSAFSFDGQYATLTVKPINYIYIGTLVVEIIQEDVWLEEAFPNNVLNGLYVGEAPSE